MSNSSDGDHTRGLEGALTRKGEARGKRDGGVSMCKIREIYYCVYKKFIITSYKDYRDVSDGLCG